MAEQNQSVWYRAAKRRWPLAQITGSGCFALVSYCVKNKIVRLYSLYPLAIMDGRESCGHAFCRMQHRVFQLAPLHDTGPSCVRNLAEIERD